jgi:hypothetical protein
MRPFRTFNATDDVLGNGHPMRSDDTGKIPDVDTEAAACQIRWRDKILWSQATVIRLGGAPSQVTHHRPMLIGYLTLEDFGWPGDVSDVHR